MDEPENEKHLKRLFAELEEAAAKVQSFSGKPEQVASESTSNIPAEPPLCSFCGKGRNQVAHMIVGRNGFICNGCVKMCQEIISDL